MAIASLSLTTQTFTATTSATIEWRAPATTRARILEISIYQITGTACTYGLGRPQAIGVGPNTVSFYTHNPTGPSTSMLGAYSWGTSSPTVPLIYHRRWNSAATVGVGVLWTFPRGLVIPASGSMVIWNITTTVACLMNCTVDD